MTISVLDNGLRLQFTSFIYSRIFWRHHHQTYYRKRNGSHIDHAIGETVCLYWQSCSWPHTFKDEFSCLPTSLSIILTWSWLNIGSYVQSRRMWVRVWDLMLASSCRCANVNSSWALYSVWWLQSNTTSSAPVQSWSSFHCLYLYTASSLPLGFWDSCSPNKQ